VRAEDGPLLDRARIRDLFTRLGERLQRRGVIGDIYVIGGAAMALAYDARRATRDVDAVLLPHGVVLEEAHALAVELGLPQWWLNEQASAYVAPGGDPHAQVTFDHPGLRVSAASPEHLLAMKAIAARRRDLEDLRVLINVLGLTTPEQVIAVCSRVFPDESLPDRARLALEDLFAPGGGES
jgi:predicted nucleotidyltransferase